VIAKSEEDMAGKCWDCKYLVDWAGTNFIQDFKCGYFREELGKPPKPLLPKMDPEKGCKFFKKRLSMGLG